MLLLLFVSPSLLLPAGRSVRLFESSTSARSSAVRARRSFQNGLARQVDANAGSATQAWLASPKVAARAGRVEALLDSGASLEAANGSSYTQLEDAVFFENVETLLKAAEEASSLTDIAIVKKNVEALLEADSSLEVAVASGLTPLLDAIMSENVELVKALIETGASLEAEDASSIPPLYLAVYRGNVEVVEALIDAGASLERRPISSPLDFAILSGVTLELAHTFAPGRAAAQPRGNMHVTKVVLEASLAADPLGVAISLTLLANILLLPYYVVFVLDGGARLATGALALMYVVMVGC